MKYLTILVLALALAGCTESHHCMGDGEVGKITRLSTVQSRNQCSSLGRTMHCVAVKERKAAIVMQDGTTRYCNVPPMVEIGDIVRLYGSTRID